MVEDNDSSADSSSDTGYSGDEAPPTTQRGDTFNRSQVNATCPSRTPGSGHPATAHLRQTPNPSPGQDTSAMRQRQGQVSSSVIAMPPRPKGTPERPIRQG